MMTRFHVRRLCVSVALCLAAAFSAWARGGGGCFLADTPILCGDGNTTDISRVRPGDHVLAFRDDFSVVTTRVNEVVTRQADEYFAVTTEQTAVNVTAEHPFYTGDGIFKELQVLGVGDMIYAFDGEAIRSQKIVAIERHSGPVTVYNLQTDDPHTFFADGLAVHNKGGGGGHGGGGHSRGSRSSHRSGGGGSGKSWQQMSTGERVMMVVMLFIMGCVFVVILIARLFQGRNKNLDYTFSRRQIDAKAGKTRKLLEFIARTDTLFQPDTLAGLVRDTFLKLQPCWEARDYAPMKPLMMADLYNQHFKQIQGLIRQHEINRLRNVQVDRVDLVNVRYTHNAGQREFTALITATLRDYYEDDRNGRFIRGDRSPAQFQEFWTFQLQDGRWLLREIEQSRESDALKDENFFESFTDVQLEQVYGEAVDKTGPAGPWLEKAVATKAVRIERLLNFLHETDKLWDRRQMLELARRLFAGMTLAREAGELKDDVAAGLFPEVAESLRAGLSAQRAKGVSTEFRNFCVRKAELLVIRNHADNTRDEYLVRLSAHAQTIVKQGDRILRQDPDVVPFEEYWTFGRLDGQWKLKEILPSAAGQAAVREENVDEDSSPDQLQWYYTKKRTV